MEANNSEANYFADVHLDDDFIFKFNIFDSVVEDVQANNDIETSGDCEINFSQINPATPDPNIFNIISDFDYVKNGIILNPQPSELKVLSDDQVQKIFQHSDSFVITHTFSFHSVFKYNEETFLQNDDIEIECGYTAISNHPLVGKIY